MNKRYTMGPLAPICFSLLAFRDNFAKERSDADLAKQRPVYLQKLAARDKFEMKFFVIGIPMFYKL